jgi:hypothetical protein
MISPSYQIHFARSETIEDAAALLREKSPEFAERGGAEVRIGAMRYPDFKTQHLVILVGPLDLNGEGLVIGMASAEEFSAKRAIRPDIRQTFIIERLDRAIVDEFGNVTLADADETRLFDVRMKPSSLPEDLTRGEVEALRGALKYMGKNAAYLDYSVLPSFGPDLPALKQLPEYPKKRELYRTAFFKAGMRQPRHGKHAG